jgi:AcrR family transcriptional regulator
VFSFNNTSFTKAFRELLQAKSFQKITVTDIAEKAGFARHTFYNHYETKEDILNYLIDSALDEYFERMVKWDIYIADPEKELRMFAHFFQVWKDNPEVVDILKNIDLDILLVERLKTFFTKFYYEIVSKEIPKVNMQFAKYIINFNAYALLGILKPWLQDGMKYSPEVMAGFLMQLTGATRRMQTVEKYKGVFV